MLILTKSWEMQRDKKVWPTYKKKNGTIEIAFVGSKILTGPRYRQRLQNSSYKYVKIMNGHFA